MINEAVFALQEGLATAEEIDNGMKLGCNHPIGPLALADMIGLDVHARGDGGLLTATSTIPSTARRRC